MDRDKPKKFSKNFSYKKFIARREKISLVEADENAKVKLNVPEIAMKYGKGGPPASELRTMKLVMKSLLNGKKEN